MDGFLVDQMLMRLGRWLRLLGLDVANPGDADDRELLSIARSENRTLITRDKALAEACRYAGASCILIRSSDLESQLKEMADHSVDLELCPQRCTICNSLLVPINPSEIDSDEYIPDSPESTWRCQGCGKLYWAGSHWKRMRETLERIRRG